MFGHGLFSESDLATAQQDITKHESAGVAPGPWPPHSAPVGRLVLDTDLMRGENYSKVQAR